MIICRKECAKSSHWVIVDRIAKNCLFLKSREGAKKREKQIFVCAVELRCLCSVLSEIEIPIHEVGDVLYALHSCMRRLPTSSISEAYQKIREKIL